MCALPRQELSKIAKCLFSGFAPYVLSPLSFGGVLDSLCHRQGYLGAQLGPRPEAWPQMGQPPVACTSIISSLEVPFGVTDKKTLKPSKIIERNKKVTSTDSLHQHLWDCV